RDFRLALGAAMKEYGGVADDAEMADYVQRKFTSQLGEIEKLLQDVSQVPVFTPAASSSRVSSPRLSSEDGDEESGVGHATADLQPVELAPKQRTNTIAVALGA